MRNKPLVPDSDSETDHMMDGRGEKGIESERKREQDGEKAWMATHEIRVRVPREAVNAGL